MQTPQKCAIKWYFRPRKRQKSARMWHESAHFVHRFKNQERTEVTDNKGDNHKPYARANVEKKREEENTLLYPPVEEVTKDTYLSARRFKSYNLKISNLPTV